MFVSGRTLLLPSGSALGRRLDPTGNGPVCNKRSFFSTLADAASSTAAKAAWVPPRGIAELRFSRLFFTARPSSTGERGTLGPTTFPLWQEVGGPFRPTVERRRAGGKLSTTRYRAKSTAGTGRIGHGSATHRTANLCGKLNCASLPRPQGRAGALNLGDDSGRHEDLITTESTEITERRIRRRETRPRRMRSTSAS